VEHGKLYNADANHNWEFSMSIRLGPFLWSALAMVMTFALGICAAAGQKVFVETQGIASPDMAATPAIGYFIGVVATVAIVLFLVPVRRLTWVFRGLFTIMYCWGVFVLLWLIWPSANHYIVLAIAVASGVGWLIWARIWLQDALLSVSLAAGASVFGFLFSPFSLVLVMSALSIYDLLAVRFGFMTWLADKLSESTALPAFVFPRKLTHFTSSVHTIRVGDLAASEADNREYTILGGGDIAFPLMLTLSIFFQADLTKAVIVAGFSLLGLLCTFVIQAMWLEGKAAPALPAIAVCSFVGLAAVRLLIP
jgi:presenilin-like A22 family membrane protease